jgi:hypothetical protein
VWGVAQGISATARAIQHTDTRIDLERRAGVLVEKAVA